MQEESFPYCCTGQELETAFCKVLFKELEFRHLILDTGILEREPRFLTPAAKDCAEGGLTSVPSPGARERDQEPRHSSHVQGFCQNFTETL
jgi:hypothetical protein